MPDKLKYFLEPLRTIKKYNGCKLNPGKSKLESLELGFVWKYINNRSNLSGVHNRLVGVKMHTDLLLHPWFIPYINQPFSVQEITEIFSKTQ